MNILNQFNSGKYIVVALYKGLCQVLWKTHVQVTLKPWEIRRGNKNTTLSRIQQVSLPQYTAIPFFQLVQPKSLALSLTSSFSYYSLLSHSLANSDCLNAQVHSESDHISLQLTTLVQPSIFSPPLLQLPLDFLALPLITYNVFLSQWTY